MKKPAKTLSDETRGAMAAFRKEANAIVKRIAKERDKMRKLIGRYEDILDTVDDGLADWEAGLERISGLL